MRFLHMWAYKCANYITKHQNESNEKRRVYYYGFQVIFGELMKVVLLIIASLILGTFKATMTAAIAFALLRRSAGGYHMNTFGKCTAVTFLMFIFAGVTAQYSYKVWPTVHIYILIMTTVLAGLIIIIKWAPADTPNKPITKPEKIQKFKRQSIIFMLVLQILLLIMSYYKQYALIISACLGVLFEGFTIAPAGYKFFTRISETQKKPASKSA